ncbi:MAG: hypothetical protein ACXWAC_14635 [Usitatibacter sp.]
MATNTASLSTDGIALGNRARLGTATVLVSLLFSLAIIASMQGPILVDETGFEAGATASQG